MFRLTFQSGPQRGRRVAVRQGPVILGRHPDCTILLSDSGVALQHAILEVQSDEGVTIRRLATEAVLRVNQRDVTEVVLRDGDVLEIGPHHIQFHSGSMVVANPSGMTARSLGLLQRVTLLAVGVLLVGQLAFLFTVSIWKRGQPPAVTPAKPQVSAATNQPPPMTNLPQIAAAPVPEKVPAVPPPPPLLVSNATPPMETTVLSNEIQQMQQEIVQLHRDVAALPKPTPMTNAAPALPPSNAISPAAEVDDLVLVQAQRMLKKTLAHAGQLDPEALDSELETIQNMAPDFVPTYIERAQVLERRDLPQAALKQWQQVKKLTQDAGLQVRAEEEITRLKHASAAKPKASVTASAVVTPPPANIAPEPAPAPHVKPSLASHPVVHLAQVEQQKFMAGEKYDEMRILRIIAVAVAGATPFNPADVEVLVTFFDRDEKSGHVMPSRAVVPGAALHAPPTATTGAALEFNATYQVPRGFWQQETQRSGGTRRYFGYRVQLLYRGEIHDQRDQPPGLLPGD